MGTVNKVIGLTFGVIFLMWFLNKPQETVTVAKGLGETYGGAVKALAPK
jgi:hypothetical protein